MSITTNTSTSVKPAESNATPRPEPPQLSAQDQASVDQFVNSGYNSTKRRPFRPLRLFFVLWIVVSLLGFISWAFTKYYDLI